MPKSKKGVSVNANLNQVSRGGQRMRLTGGQFAIFEAIFESYPRVVATDLIYQWAYDTRRSDREPDPIIIKVHVCTLRRRLAPLGLSFVSEYGRGYRLEIGAVPA
jgi:DNA-binding response OmpR family regulator